MSPTLSRLLGAVLVSLGVAAPASSFDPWSESARYEVEYRAELAPLAGSTAWRVWLPAPSDGPAQRVIETTVEAPVPHRITVDERGNRVVYLEGDATPGASAAVVARYVVERAPSRGMPADSVADAGPDDPRRFLAAQRRIPLDGLIAQLSAQESRGVEGDDAKIRAFYDYVLETMRYAKHGEGWGQGDAIWACTEKYGNCTDFHSLFLGLARAQSIPARFVIGFPIPADRSEGEVPGYHCWAEAWDPARGWVPFDASEAWKSKRFDDYFGTLPSDRIALSVGRDLVLEPPQAGAPLNYFVYPYAEIDGAPVAKLPFAFRFRRVASDTTAAGG